MHVHRSNRIEILVDVLAELVRIPPADPFAGECIVVQGRGMERWISMELARRLGVWANPDFPFPRAIIERAIAAAAGEEEAAANPFEPETLMWAVAALLPEHLERAEFAAIRSYLDGDDRGLKLIQLAARIADTFDHYAVYRPAMVLRWDTGAGDDWQAVLWRALVNRVGPQHAAARVRLLADALRAKRPLSGFPARVSVFGVSALPPLYVQVLAALSPIVELHLFLLSPSREYWGDIRSQREKIRELARRDVEASAELEALHLEAPPLLESLGRVGRDFQQVLEAEVDYLDGGRDLYVDPGTGSMLATLQSDLLSLRTRTAEDRATLPLPDDDSIAIHACHGAMREVEVLHDQLVHLFDRDHTLQPQDVVVMAPDIDAYAPFVEAVFGGAQRPEVPYRIADRSPRAANEVLEAFAATLDVLGGRLPASAVLDLLALAPVRERFGIAAEELETIRVWVTESGIRWGVDGAHRAVVGQPPAAEHTWRFGFDRLLVGYAAPTDECALYRGVLPYDDVEGVEADLLGRFVACCERLFDDRSQLERARPLEHWRDELSALLSGMVAVTSQNAYQHEGIRRALGAVAERAARAGFTGAVDLEAVRAQLEREIAGGKSARGLLAGGVTFCELVPMRSIPFRVVCLLGLNHDAFPRTRRAPGFDLIAQSPRIGDRNARDDDRYLFLEALLSARERLMVTYVGRSIGDNRELPPSVVVTELLDALERTYDGGARAAERIVRHPLQPFSPRYFDGSQPRLFSYAQRECAGARALLRVRRAARPFLVAPLPDDEPLTSVTLDDLVRFFANPSRWLLEERLGLFLRDRNDTIDDREPLALDHLERWRIGDSLLPRACRGEALDRLEPLLRGAGRLPPGALGTGVFEAVVPEVRALADTAEKARGGARAAPLAVDVVIAGVHLTGVLHDLWPRGQVAVQFSKLGKRHELSQWIRHLALNAVRPSTRSVLVGRAAEKEGALHTAWGPVMDAARQLASLVELYRSGRRLPLPLFEKSSRDYVERRRAGDGREDALAAAAKAFRSTGQRGSWQDGDDPYVEHIFGDQLPCDTGPAPGSLSFEAIARRVYEPFFEHLESAEASPTR